MTHRPVIFLYTGAAEVSDDVREKMTEAGYLPVKVADIDAVKILTAPMAIDPADLSAITVAALDALLKSASATTTHVGQFGARLAAELLAAKSKR